MSILGTQIKEKTEISEEVIANTMVGSATAAANAYLNATLTAPTPEFRTLLEDSLEQILMGHAQLSKLIADQGWDDPYGSPAEQLLETLEESKLIVEDK